MATTLNCAVGSLAPYVPSNEQPWDLARVRHLYRRIGFGARPDQLEVAQELSPFRLVDQIIDAALTQPSRPEPVWANWTADDYDDFEEESYPTYVRWMELHVDDMIQRGPREKLALFWHDHFSTRYESYFCPGHMYRYHKMLMDYAYGDFKQLVHDMTITPAMLFFLNGFENRAESPNENYARELFELFTLGVNNGYTQEDIVQASRALTGYNGWTTFCGPIEYTPWNFDDGEKTIFGQTGNYDLDGLIDLLFQQRQQQIATFICEKLYAFYVNPTIDETIVAGMAQTFLDNNFVVEPVLRELFKSEHFFDEKNQGVIVKSPMDMFVGFVREGDMPYHDGLLNWMFWYVANLGQQLMEPPDVAGWPGDRSWVDGIRLTNRWGGMDNFMYAFNDTDPDHLVNFTKWLSGNSNSPEVITQAFIDHFLPNGLNSDTAFITATEALKAEIPQNYYDTGAWNLDWDSARWQIIALLQQLIRFPEFQLA